MVVGAAKLLVRKTFKLLRPKIIFRVHNHILIGWRPCSFALGHGCGSIGVPQEPHTALSDAELGRVVLFGIIAAREVNHHLLGLLPARWATAVATCFIAVSLAATLPTEITASPVP